MRDVPGHAAWIEPTQWWRSPLAATYDLHLLCNQPSHRLHSQQDMGAASRSTKVAGREPIRLHPADAAARGLHDGDVARVRSAQGTLLAGVVVSDALSPGVAQMHTGAWYDPSAPDIADCVNGNVNVLTRDVGTSTLAQGCSGAHVLVCVERYDGPLPSIRAYDPPRLVPLGQGRVLGDPVIRSIAERTGKTPAQVVLRWHIQRGGIVFPKSVTPDRIQENTDISTSNCPPPTSRTSRR